MKTVIYYAVVVFSASILMACDRKPNEATETKREGPVMELKEEVPAPKLDSTVLRRDSTERK